ncbi:MAG: divalent-cation tolerance protein CutA [Betaproteobacteria bacterium]|nr:divalent-cation tolerance protein CutA [Betaproteobacteria bacterium]
MACENSRQAAVVVALCNAPGEDAALRIARALVREKTAACVNILPACRSVYRWRGAVEEENESPMLIKTAADKIPELKKAVLRLHPYDTPELIILRVADGLPEYLQWVMEECQE